MSHSFEEEDEIPRTGAPFDEAEFREKVTKNLVEFDRKNFPAENWANHCWYVPLVYLFFVAVEYLFFSCCFFYG